MDHCSRTSSQIRIANTISRQYSKDVKKKLTLIDAVFLRFLARTLETRKLAITYINSTTQLDDEGTLNTFLPVEESIQLANRITRSREFFVGGSVSELRELADSNPQAYEELTKINIDNINRSTRNNLPFAACKPPIQNIETDAYKQPLQTSYVLPNPVLRHLPLSMLKRDIFEVVGQMSLLESSEDIQKEPPKPPSLQSYQCELQVGQSEHRQPCIVTLMQNPYGTPASGLFAPNTQIKITNAVPRLAAQFIPLILASKPQQIKPDTSKIIAEVQNFQNHLRTSVPPPMAVDMQLQ
ncbi:MAG: hypothetical protein EZS28_029020 [Streblomastix strix]|uniref:Uncharacterized protein n=1 Tax=Streblomastix strix TaxID=222440 RepID=A0A5J4UZ04_9EUKA|nr:MAG: hypothetical protein EZS28_029020 [Streblomastix strix]